MRIFDYFQSELDVDKISYRIPIDVIYSSHCPLSGGEAAVVVADVVDVVPVAANATRPDLVVAGTVLLHRGQGGRSYLFFVEVF